MATQQGEFWYDVEIDDEGLAALFTEIAELKASVTAYNKAKKRIKERVTQLELSDGTRVRVHSWGFIYKDRKGGDMTIKPWTAGVVTGLTKISTD